MTTKRQARSSKRLTNLRKQRGKFPKLMQDVVRTSDVILEVLDARFIDDTRNIEAEKMIKQKGKEIIYVLNKVDLVDKDKLLEDIQIKKLRPFSLISCKEKRGQNKLRTKIKVLVKGIDLKGRERAQVGVIGYPNTGKSSLINLLAGGSRAKTGASAGFTKGIQKIRLTSGILLLDTPGVIPEKEYSHTENKAIQKQVTVGARDATKVKDPEMVVYGLFKTYAKQIEGFYGINSKGNVEYLIEELGRKKNLLKKGGVVDVDRAARVILSDWQKGKIKI